MQALVNFNIITKYIEKNGLTVKEFCGKCKISTSTFYKIKSGKDFQLLALFKIANVIDIQVYRFFDYSEE